MRILPVSPLSRRTALIIGAAGLLLTLAAGCGGGSSNSAIPFVTARYRQTNLVADTAGVAANTDPNLRNPWGISFSTTSPFWIANNHSGTSTLYNGSGTPQSLVVHLPAPGGGDGAPTGTVFNSTPDFVVGATGRPASFLFATEDGTLIGWNSASGTNAVIVADRSGSGAIYKGLASGTISTGNALFATDFHNGKVDRFDRNFQYIDSFTDPNVPAGFAPFNIENIGGNLYVTFAKQDADKEDDEPGVGNGFVDIFRTDGTLVKRLISGGRLNSPWGMAIAPSGFGALAGALLVGNFGDGFINAYDPNTGVPIGQMQTTNGAPLTIPGLWALSFKPGDTGSQIDTLYFTAGPGGEAHGLFGYLQPL